MRFEIAGWTTDGECGFDEISGSAPTSIRQQAMRGIAKIAIQRGEMQLAKAQYERILGKALMGRGQPAEHWAHAEYAWLHFEDNNLMVPSSQAALRLSQMLTKEAYSWSYDEIMTLSTVHQSVDGQPNG